MFHFAHVYICLPKCIPQIWTKRGLGWVCFPIRFHPCLKKGISPTILLWHQKHWQKTFLYPQCCQFLHCTSCRSYFSNQQFLWNQSYSPGNFQIRHSHWKKSNPDELSLRLSINSSTGCYNDRISLGYFERISFSQTTFLFGLRLSLYIN